LSAGGEPDRIPLGEDAQMPPRFSPTEWEEFSQFVALQDLLNDFGSLTHITLVIIDPSGGRITDQTPPHNRLCMDLIKNASAGKAVCDECDLRWGRKAFEERTYKIYSCRHGLVDFVSPIMMEGEVLGYIFGGQVRVSPESLSSQQPLSPEEVDSALDAGVLLAPPKEWYRQHARAMGIDPGEYLEALGNVRVLPRQDIEAAARILHTIADFLSRLFSHWLHNRWALAAIEDTIARLRVEARSRAEVDEIVKWALESKAVAREILGELKQRFSYRTASLQLIQNDTRTLMAGDGFNDSSPDRELLRPVSHDAIIRDIVATKQPRISSDTAKDPDWETSRTGEVRSWVGLPVVQDQTVIGLFTLDHDEAGHFTEELRPALVEFAARVAPRIWHAWLWNSAQRMIRDLEIVNEVVQVMSEKLETNDLLQTITTQIADKLHCSHCTIFLKEVTDGKMRLVPKATHGGSQETLTRVFEPGTKEEGLAGHVFISGESLVLADAREHPRFAGARKPSTAPRSMLVVPVKVGDQTIGLISADQDRYGWFTQGDRRLVDLLAQHAGIAIQRSRGLKLLQDIGNSVISQQRVEEVLRAVIDGAIRLTNTSTGVIYLISEDGRHVERTFHPPGFQHPRPRLDREDGLTRTVLREGRVLRIHNLSEEPRAHPLLRARFKSLIGVPLKIENEVIGVFYLNDEAPHVFTQNEESLLSTLATQAAIAIQKARPVEDLRQQVQIRSLLEDVSQRLVVPQQDQNGALDRIGEGIRELLGPEVSPTINLYDEETDRFGACHAYGPLAAHLRDDPRPSGGTGRYVLAKKQSLYLEDTLHPPPGHPTIRPQSIALGVKSFAAVPLKRQSRIVGLLFLNSQKPLRFDDEIRRVLDTFANQAGIAIEIARLHEGVPISAGLLRAADLGFLASGLAHEFYNSLHVMVSLLDRIESSRKPDIKAGFLLTLRNEIGRAVRSIDMFRDYRDRSGDVECVNLRTFVQELLARLEHRAKHHHVRLTCSHLDVGEVRIDSTRVQSVILNLLRNAMDAVEGFQGDRQIEVQTLQRDDQAIEIVVMDSGPGIPPEVREKIFFPYFTTKGAGRMGIGLSLVRRIVDGMGGMIEVEPKNVLGGATFRVRLPVQQDRERIADE
jgi:two-component system, NtrC family, sensor kinase